MIVKVFYICKEALDLEKEKKRSREQLNNGKLGAFLVFLLQKIVWSIGDAYWEINL